MIRHAIDPLQLMQRMADQAFAMVEAADGALVGVVNDADSVRFVCASGNLKNRAGELIRLDGSLTGMAIRTGGTQLTQDTESDPRVNREVTRRFGIRSSVCVPLGRDKMRVGVLHVSSSQPCAFDEHEVVLLDGLAEFMSTVITAASDFMGITSKLFHHRGHANQAELHGVEQDAMRAEMFVAGVLDPSAARRLEIRERIERILREQEFSIAFQPIFALDAGVLFGAEALVRFADCDRRPPNVCLAEAHKVGLGVELEVAIVRRALGQLPRLPAGAMLSLNAGPDALASAAIAEALAEADPARVVVELTEHVKVDDYPQLAEAIGRLRGSGIRLAIDDAGAGFASLMHILKLAPDFIKLDRELISGVDIDPVRQSLAGSLIRFAEETGAIIVAEGIETADELGIIRDLGIRHGQGFHLALPAPLEKMRLSMVGHAPQPAPASLWLPPASGAVVGPAA